MIEVDQRYYGLEVGNGMSADGSDVSRHQRRFGIGLLLTVATLGLYGIYWHYVTYDELDRTFGRYDIPMWAYVLMWLPVVGLIGYAPYMIAYLRDLTDAREQVGLGPGPSVGRHLAWTFLGAPFLLVGPIMAYHRLQGSLNELWAEAADTIAQGNPGQAATEEQPLAPR